MRRTQPHQRKSLHPWNPRNWFVNFLSFCEKVRGEGAKRRKKVRKDFSVKPSPNPLLKASMFGGDEIKLAPE